MTQEALKLAIQLRDTASGYWTENEIPIIEKLIELLAQPAQEPVAKYCCHVCFDKSGQTFLDRMILCSECGNKRCPKATNHALPCTNSNNPLQPAQEPVAWLCKADENGLFNDLPTADKACEDCFPVYTAPPQPAQEPVTWMGNKDFEPIRVRIMQEAYELADRNDSEGYNAIKAMCGDVQRMLPPQRTWVDLTDGEIAELHYEIKVQLMGAYKIEDIYRAIEAKLKEKNNG